MDSAKFEAAIDETYANYSRAGLISRAQQILLVVVCLVLAYFKLWNWVWLVLGLQAINVVRDGLLGVVVALTNLFVAKLREFDRGGM